MPKETVEEEIGAMLDDVTPPEAKGEVDEVDKEIAAAEEAAVKAATDEKEVAKPVEPVEPVEPIKEEVIEKKPVEEEEEEVVAKKPIEKEKEPVEPIEDEITEAQVLRDTITQLSAQIQGQQRVPTKKEEEKPAETPPPEDKKKPVEPAVIPFVDDTSFNEVITSAESMNDLMNKMYNTVMDSVNRLWRGVPDMVSQNVQQQVNMRTMITDFYKANEDLLPYRSFVGVVTNELASKNPDWSYERLFEKVGPEVKRRLNMGAVKPAGSPLQRKKGTPAFAKKPKVGDHRKVSDNRTELQIEIDDLITTE